VNDGMTYPINLETAYPSVVNEMGQRLLACESMLTDLSQNHDRPDAWMVSDLVKLQMRKVCEMVMLGSAFAHLWDGHSEFDLNTWHPKDTFGALKDLNDHPLPIPIELEFRAHESGARQIMPASKPMPFRVLSTIYGRCNDLLHLPSVAKVLKNKVQPFDIGQFQTWVAGFKRLLLGHVLMLPHRSTILLCTWSGNAEDRPSVFVMEAEGPSIFDYSALPDFELVPA
jgi:hypothetical protein